MGNNGRNYFSSILAFIWLVSLMTTSAILTGERKLIKSKLGNDESSPNHMKFHEIETEFSDLTHETMSGPSTYRYHPLTELFAQPQMAQSDQMNIQPGVTDQNHYLEELASQAIEGSRRNINLNRQSASFGSKTDYKKTVENNGVLGVDGSRTKRQSSSVAGEIGFSNNVDFVFGKNVEIEPKQLITEPSKRQSNEFSDQSDFWRQTINGQTGFGVKAGFSGAADTVGNQKLTNQKTERSKRQSSGFGAQTGFGANIGFGAGGGVGGTTGNADKKTRAGFGAQGNMGASVGFGVGRGTRAAVQ